MRAIVNATLQIVYITSLATIFFVHTIRHI